MCGIVGVVGKNKIGLSQTDVKIFQQMLLVDQVRGVDGTGIFYNSKRNTKQIATLKGAVDSNVFLENKNTEKSMQTIYKESNFVIGHNRASTKGANTPQNTHPFREKHITLVHNGTLTTQKELHPTVVVDSHAICHSIAEIGAKETLKKINGAFALVWFDAKLGKLFFCRNSQRPLNVIETKDSFFFASEAKMAEWIIDRNNGGKIISTLEVKPWQLYSIDLESLGTIESEYAEYKTFTNYTPPVVQQSFPQYPLGSWYGKQDDTAANEDTATDVKELPSVARFPIPHAFYNRGDDVLFRPVSIVTNSKEGTYLIGDMYKTKMLVDKKDRVNAFDYEGKNRLKVYGTWSELHELYTTPHLMAKIQTSKMGEKGQIFYITNVNHVITEPDKFGVGKCSVCDSEFPLDELTRIEEWDTCETCATIIGAGYASACCQ